MKLSNLASESVRIFILFSIYFFLLVFFLSIPYMSLCIASIFLMTISPGFPMGFYAYIYGLRKQHTRTCNTITFGGDITDKSF